MAIHTTYTDARANFAALCTRVAADRETVVINRRGAEDVVLISASELRGIVETAHLLRSPKNAERLLKALNRAKQKSRRKPQTIESLRRELGVDSQK